MNNEKLLIGTTRADFIDQNRYLSTDFAALEKQKLWLNVWQWACRLEETSAVGDYVVYDIVDQSIIVVRVSPSEIKAFHNVCPHRGRRLLSGSGKITKFHCIFHAWQWDLNGQNTRVLDHQQWDGCEGMSQQALGLAEVHTAQWGGFVFINMAATPEPFDEFISPVPEHLDILRIDNMRYAWRRSIKVKANWKVAMEAFMESYHVMGTHPQFLPLVDEVSLARVQKKHGNHGVTYEYPPGSPSRRLNKPALSDDELRENFGRLIESFGVQLGLGNGDGQTSARSIKAGVAAIKALSKGKKSKGTSPEESAAAAIKAMREAAEADGAYFPVIPFEHQLKMGTVWNIFPTMSIVWGFDGTLIFRPRPDPEDPYNPSAAIIEMIALLHYGKGKQPPEDHQFISDWRTQHKGLIPPLLVQDLINMEDVQKGMKSIGLKGLRPNPGEEIQITNFHKIIDQYLSK